MAIQLLIGCRSRFLGASLVVQFDSCSAIDVIDVVQRCDHLLSALARKPTVVLLDLELARDYFAASERSADSSILLLEPPDNSWEIPLQSWVPRGLAGIFHDDQNPALLPKAVAGIAGGELWFDHQAMKRAFVTHHHTSPPTRLTTRESEVLNLICAGATNKEIAGKLFVSEQTIKTHCNHILKKFGCKNRLTLALQASRLVPPRPFHTPHPLG